MGERVYVYEVNAYGEYLGTDGYGNALIYISEDDMTITVEPGGWDSPA